MAETCKYCQREQSFVCKNTRDMEAPDFSVGDSVCLAQLAKLGGGERSAPPPKTFADGWRECREAAAKVLDTESYHIPVARGVRGAELRGFAAAIRNMEPPEDTP